MEIVSRPIDQRLNVTEILSGTVFDATGFRRISLRTAESILVAPDGPWVHPFRILNRGPDRVVIAEYPGPKRPVHLSENEYHDFLLCQADGTYRILHRAADTSAMPRATSDG